jgi:hypothetical protein
MRFFLLTVLLVPLSGLALSPEAKEFMEISKRLEPMQCEKRKLRREIALAEIEQRADDARALKQKFASLDRNPGTAALEKRLAVLERRMSNGRGGTLDPEDLQAISNQHRDAFYRCD